MGTPLENQRIFNDTTGGALAGNIRRIALALPIITVVIGVGVEANRLLDTEGDIDIGVVSQICSVLLGSVLMCFKG